MRASLNGPAPAGRFERSLLALSRACARRPGACLGLVAVLSLGFAALLPLLQLRTDGAALHPEHAAAVVRTAQDRRTFRDPEELVVLATPRAGRPPLTTAAGLRGLVQLHADIAAVEGVDVAGVRSVASLVDVARSSVGSLGTYLQQIPDDGPELAALVQRMGERPMTHGLFLTPDGNAAALYVPLAAGSDRQEAAGILSRWVAERDDSEVELRLLGPVLAETILGEQILGDLARLVPIMILVMAALLLACLRTPGSLLVAMANMLVVLVWTLGFMSLARIPVTLVTTILPVLLLAMCMTDEIHVLARLQDRIGARKPVPDPTGAPDEILDVLMELQRPLVSMSLTTAIGFLSFLAVSIGPMRHFGLLAAFGLLVAMLMTFSLTPAMVARMPSSWFVPRFGRSCMARGPLPHERLLLRNRGAALAIGIVVVLALSPGLLRLTVQDSWVRNFDQDSSLVRAERDFNAALWGTYRCDVVFTGRPGFFQEPQGVALVAEAASRAAAAPSVGGVVSHLDVLDTVAEMLGLAGRAAEQPADALRAVVQVGADYDWPELGRLATASGESARLLVVVNDADYVKSRALVERLREDLAPLADAAGVQMHLSGDLPLALATVTAIVSGQLRSIAWTLAGIGALLLAVSRRLGMTVVQVLPSVAAASVMLAIMGHAGMPLGIATSMFAALTVGVGVDLALHLTSAHERALALGLAPADAVASAVETTGPGQRWSTLVLAIGFLVLTASSFAPNRDLGILLSGSMLAAYLTTYLFVPRLLAR